MAFDVYGALDFGLVCLLLADHFEDVLQLQRRSESYTELYPKIGCHNMSKTAPLLPLDIWREYCGWNPWHFWGFGDNDKLYWTTECNTIVQEHAWQNENASGRHELRQAIIDAERVLLDYLGFAVAPRYVSWEIMSGSGFTASFRAKNKSLPAPEGWVHSVGVESLDLKYPNTPVSYVDTNGDGYFDVAVVGPLSLAEYSLPWAVYFSEADRPLRAPVEDVYRIQPIEVVKDNTGTYIHLRPWLLAKPKTYDTSIEAVIMDPKNLGWFVSTVDLYLRTTATSGTTLETAPAVVEWFNAPCHGWWCSCGCNQGEGQQASQSIAALGVFNRELGYLTPVQAIYNAQSGVWSSQGWPCSLPDKAYVRALAGYPLQSNGVMDVRLAQVVSRLAAANMPHPIAGCDTANRFIFYWQQDLAKTGTATDETFATSQQVLDCPFGTRRGQVYAWKQVATLERMSGSRP